MLTEEISTYIESVPSRKQQLLDQIDLFKTELVEVIADKDLGDPLKFEFEVSEEIRAVIIKHTKLLDYINQSVFNIHMLNRGNALEKETIIKSSVALLKEQLQRGSITSKELIERTEIMLNK